MKPKTVTVQTEFKTWAKNSESLGGTIAVTFEVPEGLEGKILKKQILNEKKGLDLLVLMSEYLRGSLSEEDYMRKRQVCVNGYNKVLKDEDGHEPIPES